MTEREAVARALCWSNGMDPDLTLGGDGQNFLWMEYERQADAAIAAMGEREVKVPEAMRIADRVLSELEEYDSDLTSGSEIHRVRAALRALAGDGQ